MSWKCCLALGVSLLVAVPAYTQTAIGGPAKLLFLADVQKELKLTEEQVAKGKELTRQLNEKFADDLDSLKGLKGDELRDKRQQLRKQVVDETNKALASFLDAQQSRRLKQIYLQVQGSQIFLDPAVQKTLKLDDEQKAQIKTINLESAKQLRDIVGKADAEKVEAVSKSIGAARDKAKQQTLALLNDEQKAAWKKLEGKPFDIKFEDFFEVP